MAPGPCRKSSRFNVGLPSCQFNDRAKLTQRHAGRGAEGAFQTLAVDLRKLRNILEDIEEATPDGHHGRFFAQVPQCKAILLGFDLTLQSDHYPEQQSSQPQCVLAAKASTQILTSSLAYALDETTAYPQHEVDFTRNVPAEGDAARQSTQSNASNDSPSPTDISSAATNKTSSNRSSAKIVGLESGQIPKMSVISLQAIVNGKHAVRPVLHRDVTSTPADAGPINWGPLSISTASVSSNDPQAVYERVTEQFAKPPPIIPRITIMNCDNEIPDMVADMPEESACSDTDVSRSSCNSDRSNDRPASTTSQLERLHPRHSSASTTEQVYVPYRPWYGTSESPSPVAKKLHDVNSQDNNLALHGLDGEQGGTELADDASLEAATDILFAELPPLVRCNGIRHEPRPVLSKQTEISYTTTHACTPTFTATDNTKQAQAAGSASSAASSS